MWTSRLLYRTACCLGLLRHRLECLLWLLDMFNNYTINTKCSFLFLGSLCVFIWKRGIFRLQQHRSFVLVPAGPDLRRLVHRRSRGRVLRALPGTGHTWGKNIDRKFEDIVWLFVAILMVTQYMLQRRDLLYKLVIKCFSHFRRIVSCKSS